MLRVITSPPTRDTSPAEFIAAVVCLVNMTTLLGEDLLKRSNTSSSLLTDVINAFLLLIFDGCSQPNQFLSAAVYEHRRRGSIILQNNNMQPAAIVNIDTKTTPDVLAEYALIQLMRKSARLKHHFDIIATAIIPAAALGPKGDVAAPRLVGALAAALSTASVFNLTLDFFNSLYEASTKNNNKIITRMQLSLLSACLHQVQSQQQQQKSKKAVMTPNTAPIEINLLDPVFCFLDCNTVVDVGVFCEYLYAVGHVYGAVAVAAASSVKIPCLSEVIRDVQIRVRCPMSHRAVHSLLRGCAEASAVSSSSSCSCSIPLEPIFHEIDTLLLSLSLPKTKNEVVEMWTFVVVMSGNHLNENRTRIVRMLRYVRESIFSDNNKSDAKYLRAVFYLVRAILVASVSGEVKVKEDGDNHRDDIVSVVVAWIFAFARDVQVIVDEDDNDDEQQQQDNNSDSFDSKSYCYYYSLHTLACALLLEAALQIQNEQLISYVKDIIHRKAFDEEQENEEEGNNNVSFSFSSSGGGGGLGEEEREEKKNNVLFLRLVDYCDDVQLVCSSSTVVRCRHRSSPLCISRITHATLLVYFFSSSSSTSTSTSSSYRQLFTSCDMRRCEDFLETSAPLVELLLPVEDINNEKEEEEEKEEESASDEMFEYRNIGDHHPLEMLLPTNPPGNEEEEDPDRTSAMIQLQEWRDSLDDAEDRQFASDEALARYLTARKNKYSAARHMLEKSLQWRVQALPRPKCVMRCHLCDVDPYQHCFIPLGFDCFGNVVVYGCAPRARNHDADHAVRHVTQTLFYIWESFPFSKQWVWIVDFNGYGLTHAMQAKIGIAFLTTFDNHFPERLRAVILVNPPSVFQVLLKALKPFGDERTWAKLRTVKGKPEEVSRALAKNFGIVSNTTLTWIERVLSMEPKPGNMPLLPKRYRKYFLPEQSSDDSVGTAVDLLFSEEF
eukprot:PhM_4_TR18462/c0_g1_i1/m.77200